MTIPEVKLPDGVLFMEMIDRAKGCLLGLAVGDAVGTSVEFEPRGSFEPVADMIGGGIFGLEPGQWTDDTSMALCLAASLVEKGGFDPADQMDRYVRWWKNGYYSSTGHCFDIGGTIRNALAAFERTGEPFSGLTDPQSSGNGCIMRIAPIPIAYQWDEKMAIHYGGESSRTTHGSTQSIEASQLFTSMLRKAILGADKKSILLSSGGFEITTPSIQKIAEGAYFSKPIDEIRGNGYVVTALEAALWCFAKTESFMQAVLKATNLGEDADTTAAICGQIAGAYYGIGAIPPQWLEKLAMRDEIEALAQQLVGCTEPGYSR